MRAVWRALHQSARSHATNLLFTRQHPHLVSQTSLDALPFPLLVLEDAIMQQGQHLNLLLSRMIAGIDHHLANLSPSLCVVQGDTSSALAGALASFQRQIPVAHIEAGLRTPSLTDPFPEEANRRLISRLATLHFAPTPEAAENLRREGISRHIFTTGNPGIDALFSPHERLSETRDPWITKALASDRPLVLLTLHRRENLDRLTLILEQLLALSSRHPDLLFIWPRHPNPLILQASDAILGPYPERFLLTSHLPHHRFLELLASASLVLTDSGGLQEEAITLGKPLAIVRNHSDRPEGLVRPDVCLLEPRHGDDLFSPLTPLLAKLDTCSSPPSTPPSPHQSIYGDGLAGARIANLLLDFLHGSI